MALGSRILPEAQRSIAFGSISGTYAAIGTPLVNPAVFIMFINASNADLQISLDGINDTFVLLARSTFVFDISSDRVATNGLFLSVGTSIWVKTLGAPTTGAVYVSSWYVENK